MTNITVSITISNADPPQRTETTMSEAKQLINYDEYLREQAELLRGRLQKPKTPKVSLAGKRFTLPNGEASPGPMNVIILNFAYITRWFEKPYQQGSHNEPDCMAVSLVEEELVPLERSPKIQHTDCKTCPKNQFGSAQSGKGKACRNAIRLAVVQPKYDENSEILIVEPSATAITRWNAYSSLMGARYISPIGANITELDFDPNMSVPSLVFRDKGPIKGDTILMELRQRTEALLLKELD